MILCDVLVLTLMCPSVETEVPRAMPVSYEVRIPAPPVLTKTRIKTDPLFLAGIPENWDQLRGLSPAGWPDFCATLRSRITPPNSDLIAQALLQSDCVRD